MLAQVMKVGPKYQVTIPKPVREEIGLKAGDLVRARVGKGRTITMERVRLVNFDTELEEDLAAAEADYKAGRVLGPFETADETVAALKRAANVPKLPKSTATDKKARRRALKGSTRAAHRAVKRSAHARAAHA